MIDNRDTVAPLIEARKRIEEQIDILLGKVAAMRKRYDALQAAIEVLRSPDYELEGIQVRPSRPKRITEFNEQAVEDQVLRLLESGPMSRSDIQRRLSDLGMIHSLVGLKRILKSCPKITIKGERDQTRYSLAKVAANS